jgi:hypothetical protein
MARRDRNNNELVVCLHGSLSGEPNRVSPHRHGSAIENDGCPIDIR